MGRVTMVMATTRKRTESAERGKSDSGKTKQGAEAGVTTIRQHFFSFLFVFRFGMGCCGGRAVHSNSQWHALSASGGEKGSPTL